MLRLLHELTVRFPTVQLLITSRVPLQDQFGRAAPSAKPVKLLGLSHVKSAELLCRRLIGACDSTREGLVWRKATALVGVGAQMPFGAEAFEAVGRSPAWIEANTHHLHNEPRAILELARALASALGSNDEDAAGGMTLPTWWSAWSDKTRAADGSSRRRRWRPRRAADDDDDDDAGLLAMAAQARRQVDAEESRRLRRARVAWLKGLPRVARRLRWAQLAAAHASRSSPRARAIGSRRRRDLRAARAAATRSSSRSTATSTAASRSTRSARST